MLQLEKLGRSIACHGVALLLVWIGGLKFLDYEAKGVHFMVSNHPLLGWVYSIFSVRTFAAVLGALEICIALLIVLRPWKPALSLAGGLAASGLFLTTLTFLLTTPRVVGGGVWFPGLEHRLAIPAEGCR